jgi:hypothetical protein
MKTVAALTMLIATLGGISVAHSTIGIGTVTRIQPYHQESSIRAVHVKGGYRVISTASHHP